MFFKNPQSCWFNTFFDGMEDIQISAGDLYQNNTSFRIEFIKPYTTKVMAELVVNFKIWMSFKMTYGFKIVDIKIGKPLVDYNVTCTSNHSEYGELLNDMDITKSFDLVFKQLLIDKEIPLYEWFLANHYKLQFVNITFKDTEFILRDKYIAVFLNPNFKTMMEFLIKAVCPEDWIKKDKSLFWKIV